VLQVSFMKVSRHKIATVLSNQTFKPGLDVAMFSREVAAYLLDTGRTSELSSLLRDVVQNRAEQGVVEVTAVSAHTLDDTARADIEQEARKQYKYAKQIIIHEVIDLTVIGGVRLEFPTEQLDLSIRYRLNRFKQLTSAGKD
jgi:F0F1-type ATP synthase delta subunit